MSRETTESSTITFVVTGATGRMGRAVIDTAVQREDIASVVGVSRSPPAEEIAGATVRPASELREVLEETDADALVDFTAPESSVTYV